jgi:hypothetical protein
LAYASLPLSFELNQGQTDARVRFLAHGQGYSLFLTEDEAVLTLQKGRQLSVVSRQLQETDNGQPTTDVLRMKFIGTNPNVAVVASEELPGKSNYFIGQDPRGWHTDVPTYARVRYQGLYPGVDVVYYGRQGQLEYDVVVGPGKDARQVRFRIEGEEKARLNGAGELVLETKGGEVILQRPKAYQASGAGKRTVAVRYARRGRNEWGFEVEKYRHDEPLIIDPFLNYSTYLGGSGGDLAYGIAVDSSDNAYVAGFTNSSNFPTQYAEQSKYAGNGDAFVAKLDSTGTALIYSTYLGGSKGIAGQTCSGADSAFGLAIDSGGDAFVTGQTCSVDFPIKPEPIVGPPPTPGAFQTTYGGNGDAFVTELGSKGDTLVYSSYLGGSGADWGYAITVDSSGHAFVTGATQSGDFPTQSPFQASKAGLQNAFVTEVSFDGTALVYSTFLGGSQTDTGQAIKVDGSGDAYIAGYTFSSDFPIHNPLYGSNGGKTSADAFVTELNPGGSALVFSTYLGGTGRDRAFGLALDSSANIYVVGDTTSSDFPTTSGVLQTTYAGNGDAFVSKLGPSGASLVYSTFIGGSGVDQGNAIAVDSSGNAVAVGFTQSSDFPTFDPFQAVLGLTGGSTCSSGPCPDAFVTVLNPSGGQGSYSSYLGGSGADYGEAVALDSSKPPNVYVAGSTTSNNFPVVAGASAGAFQGDLGGVAGNAFVAMIEPADSPAIALAPAKVNFGNQTVSVPSPVQTVTVVDAGSAPLQITQIIPPSTDFTESNDCVGTVAARGGTCTINLVFTPTATGVVTDQVSITDNAANSPQTITVTGDGVNSQQSVTLSPTSFTFPNTIVGSQSPAQTVTITNTGTASITFINSGGASPITITGNTSDFTITTNTCAALGYVLNVGQSCSVSVIFQPTTSGARAGSLGIYDTATGSPQSVALSGTGLAQFSLSATATTVNPIIGTTATTCSSTPSTCFTISASAVSGFSGVITPSCPSSVTCTFTPTSFFAGQTTTLTLSNLTLTTPNPLNFMITGTSGTQTAQLSLTLAFQTFTLSVSPALDSVVGGSPAHYTILATPSNGFNQQVNFSCTLSGGAALPLGTGCIFTPTSPTLSGSSPTSIALTITTTQSVPTTSSMWKLWPGPGRRPPPRPLSLLGALWLALALVSFFWGRPSMAHGLRQGFSPSRRLIASRAFIFGTLLAFLLFLASCRGAVSNSGATPCGNYIFNIIGTLNSNTAVTVTQPVDLTVTSLNCPTT